MKKLSSIKIDPKDMRMIRGYFYSLQRFLDFMIWIIKNDSEKFESIMNDYDDYLQMKEMEKELYK